MDSERPESSVLVVRRMISGSLSDIHLARFLSTVGRGKRSVGSDADNVSAVRGGVGGGVVVGGSFEFGGVASDLSTESDCFCKS